MAIEPTTIVSASPRARGTRAQLVRVMRISAVIALAATTGRPASAQDVLVLRGGTVHTAAGPVIPNGTVVIRDGKIAAVGANVPLPAGAKVIDVAGKEIIPGIIDNHSHVGFRLEEANEFPQSWIPHLRVLDTLDPDAPEWRDVVAGGVTTVVTGPGSGEEASGQAVVLKTFGPTLRDRILRERGGIKFALGRRTGDRGGRPVTSAAILASFRQQFIRAREYAEAQKRWIEGGRVGAPPPRDLALEALGLVLSREQDARVHVHAEHDIMALLRMKDEFGFDLTIHHGTDAYLLGPELAKRGVSVVGMPLGFYFGQPDEVMAAGAALSKQGVRFAFHTDDPAQASRWERLNASIAIHHGMAELEALKALTINGAEIARVANRVGSIEIGKDADLVVLDGTWYELRTRVDLVYVGGRLAYERKRDQ